MEREGAPRMKSDLSERDIVELLRYSRHDWLNHIQLIKGYLSMGKLDRVREIIDQIVEESEQAAKLSNLNLPLFAALFLTYNWKNPRVYLSYRINGEGKLSEEQDGRITHWFETFFQYLNSEVPDNCEYKVMVSIQPLGSYACFDIEFHGEIPESGQVMNFLLSNKKEWKIENLHKESGSLTFSVQL